MMATTELHKIPDTILSRSQVFELRALPTKAIATHLRKIADAEGIQIPDAALSLIARSAEGSMRDAQSALDQVMAFAGQTISLDDVSTVLGVVGRDLLFELIEAVVSEDGARAFALADRAAESGHDLRLICRELSRVMRDMMMLSVDPSRAEDGDLAEGELERLSALAKSFSREDLMRAFDLLAKSEQEIRASSQPRYYFEMLLLRWMHLRKLVPLTELLEQMGGKPPAVAPRTVAPRTIAPRPVDPRTSAPAPAPAPAHPRTSAPSHPSSPPSGPSDGSFKDRFLAEVRAGKGFFYNTVVAQAQRIDVVDDRVTFTFLPTHRALREQFDQTRTWLESTAGRIAGRRVVVTAVQAPAAAEEPAPVQEIKEDKSKRDLRAEAMSSSAVQAMLDVFPAEIRDIEEM